MSADNLEAKPGSGLDDFDGLQWMRDGIWGSEPRWTVEPDRDAIRQTVASSLNLTAAAPCTIDFLAQGAFNKVYIVAFPDEGKEPEEVIARVALPVDPKWKTLSEVATLHWVRDNTSLPVPEVIAYQADRTSAIGLEWIVMSKMPGRALAGRWRGVTFSAKEAIVRRLAVFCSETFRAQLRGIGSLYLDDTGPVFRVGRIVSREFIWDSHIHAPAPRGPFHSSRDWLLARLSLAETDCHERLSRLQSAGPENEDLDLDDLEDLHHTLGIISRLRRHLDSFFPPPGPASDLSPERTMLLHDDLSRHNILVDDHGTLTAVVDWECVAAVPLWYACQIPPLLHGKHRDVKPVEAQYQHDENGNVDELFWEHLDEYELTRLRRVFLAEMGRLQPGWVEVFEKSRRQRDFDLAVSGCDDAFLIRRIREWLGDVERGGEGFEGLEERIDNASL